MKVLDLFSGIGGFSLGLKRAGMETVAFCENDEFCRKVLRKHWQKYLGHPIFRDIKKLKYLETKRGYCLSGPTDLSRSASACRPGRIDVICGGFPCQDISIAGKKKGVKR